MISEVIIREHFQKDWITIIFFVVLLLLFIMNGLYHERLKNTMSFLMYGNNAQQERKEFSIFFNYYHLLLFFIHVLVFSLLIYFVIIYFYSALFQSNSFALFAKILFSYFLYALVYYSVNFIISGLFDISQSYDRLTFLKFSYLNTIILLMLPLLFIVAYASKGNKLLLKLTLTIFLLLSAWRFLRILISNKNLIFNKLFYFILYLCTLEIAPIIVVYSIMNKNS